MCASITQIVIRLEYVGNWHFSKQASNEVCGGSVACKGMNHRSW